jgi:hypothetical protein
MGWTVSLANTSRAQSGGIICSTTHIETNRFVRSSSA